MAALRAEKMQSGGSAPHPPAKGHTPFGIPHSRMFSADFAAANILDRCEGRMRRRNSSHHLVIKFSVNMGRA